MLTVIKPVRKQKKKILLHYKPKSALACHLYGWLILQLMTDMP